MKTQLQASVRTYQGNFTFTGTEASAVVSAVKAHQDILAEGNDGEYTYSVQIPYTSVISVDYWTEQVESTTEDDNCKVQTPEPEAPEVASLVLHNKGLTTLSATTITLSDTSINGTYSGVTFTNGVATITNGTIAAGESLTISGLPDGVQVSARVGNGTAVTGTTPCTLELTNPQM